MTGQTDMQGGTWHRNCINNWGKEVGDNKDTRCMGAVGGHCPLPYTNSTPNEIKTTSLVPCE